MRAFSAADILRIWEIGLRQSPLARALTLLRAASPEIPDEELAALPIGRRDSRLLEMRERLFGRQLNAFAECPGCHERLEIAFRTTDIAQRDDPPALLHHEADGFAVRFRLPSSADLAATVEGATVENGRGVLLQRCVVSATHGGLPLTAGELPAAILDEVTRQMATADPAAEVLVDLQCPTCAHGWQIVFDIAAFLWAEVAAQGRRLLREVDALARVYGWSESEILSMSAPRRQAYLEIVRT